MKKITLIIGAPESGKTRTLYQIAAEYHNSDTVRINAKNLHTPNHFAFGPCNENTKLLIVKELENSDQLYEFYPLINGLTVNEPHKDPYIIYPRIIITSSKITSDKLPAGASFTERFNVLDMDSINRF